MFSLGKDQLISAKPIPPGKYLLEITEYTEALSKAGDSTNYTFEFAVQDEKYTGKVIKKLWNEKALDKAIPDAVNSLESLLSSCGIHTAEGGVFDGNKLKGKQVFGFVTLEKSSDSKSTFNGIESFAPAA